MQSPLSGTMRSELFNNRSTLVLPGTSRVVQGMGVRERSTTEHHPHQVPANVRAMGESRASKLTDAVPHYDEISVLQYISSHNLRKHIKVTFPITIPEWPVVGRGRIFTVRRFPTGWGYDQVEDNYFTAAAAVKCLASSVRSGEEERSLRYRCLVQELRILLHEPIKKHPNFSTISELGWEPDPLAQNCFLPCLHEEYAIFGSLDNLMGAIDMDYVWKQRFMLDVAEGLAALHKCGIAHSDVKMENVMVFRCEDALFDIIAKLSDFGFSVEIDRSDQETKLIGCTPLWAAPEVLESYNNLDLVSADIYSLGFVIWGIAIDGANPTKALDALICSDDIIGDWATWKQSNELVSLAAAQLHSVDNPGTLDVEEVCHLVSLVLQADPAERDIHAVLHRLRGRCKRTSQHEDFENVEYSTLPPFDHNAASNLNLHYSTVLTRQSRSI
jgi:serine/threonine protein kinase